MKIGIIAAMEEELHTLRERLDTQEETQFGPFLYYTGRLCEHDVALLLCGIGKVNAAVGATLLINKFGPDYVVNTGVAGGFPPDKLNIGDIVISNEVRHHDADATVFNYEYGQIPRMPVAYEADEKLRRLSLGFVPERSSIKVHEGQILSGDSFISQQKQITEISEKFPQIMAVEMEGAAIAQSCYLFGIPFVIIRSISDLVLVDESHNMYKDFVTTAAENSVALVINLLTKLH